MEKKLTTGREFWHTIPGWYTWPEFYKEMADEIPEGGTAVEVGVFCGKSIFDFAWLVEDRDINVYAVDNFKGCPSDSQVRTFIEEMGGDLFKIFMENMERCGLDGICPIRGDSADSAGEFSDQSCDLVYIDADHAYEGVLRDVKAWLPKVKPGGMLSGHDIMQSQVRRAVEMALGVGGFEIDKRQNVWKHRVESE